MHWHRAPGTPLLPPLSIHLPGHYLELQQSPTSDSTPRVPVPRVEIKEEEGGEEGHDGK